jgi:hypothetical protein
MPEISGYELIGYLASVLVAVSLMMVRIVRLRIVNLCGALGFAVYGWLIGSMPVAGMNAFIVCINCYHLWRLASVKEAFSVVAISPGDPYLHELLKHFAADIALEQPDFKGFQEDMQFSRLVIRNGRPAGVLIGNFDSDQGRLRIDLDYALPEYKDFATGRFLFETLSQTLANDKVVAIASTPSHPLHTKYLHKMGFRAEKNGNYWKRDL